MVHRSRPERYVGYPMFLIPYLIGVTLFAIVLLRPLLNVHSAIKRSHIVMYVIMCIMWPVTLLLVILALVLCVGE